VARKAGAGAAGLILLTLCAGQFLMMLDSSVMNVSIATVAKDVGTTVTGIQTAITLYTLVMASFMITGGKIGQIIGRKRAFAIGCVIYGCGSMTTALAPNLPVLLIGLAAAMTGLRLGGRRSPRTRYRPDPWGARAWLVAGSGVAVAALMIAATGYASAALDPPAVPLSAPSLPLWPAACVLLGLLPAVAAPRGAVR